MKNPQQSQVKHSRLAVMIAIASTFIFIALSFSPAVLPASATTGDLLDLGIITSSALTGAAIGGGLADGPGAAVGALVGSMFGLWMTWDNGQAGEDWSNPQGFWAREKAADMRDMFNLSDAQAENLLVSFQGLTLFYARKAEYGAKMLYDYQTEHNLSHNFNSEYVLAHSWVYAGAMSQLWALTETYNQVLGAFDDVASSFIGSYAGMAWGAFTENMAGDGYASTTTEPLVMRACMDLSTLNDSTYVVINPAIPLWLHKNPTTSSDTVALKLYDSDGVLALNFSQTLLDDVAVATVNLTAAGLGIGKYHIDVTAGWAVTGLAVPSETSPGNVIPQLSIFSRKSTWNETLQWQADIKVQGSADDGHFYCKDKTAGSGIWGIDQSPTIPKIQFMTQANGWGGVPVNQTMPLGYASPTKDGFLALIKQAVADTTAMYSTVIAFAQTQYNLIKATGGTYSPPPADMIFADPIQMQNLSWEQITLMYEAYMAQAIDWYANYSVMRPNNINFSAESLKLVIRGELRDANNLTICDNSTVMTPFVSLNNMSLETSSWSYFDQPGFVMVWGNTSEADAGGPDYGTGRHGPVTTDFNITKCTFISVQDGWSIMPYEMIYDGEYNASVTLHVTQLNYVIANITDQGDNSPPQALGDWQWLLDHWYYIGFIAAGALLLAAVKGGWVVAIIGLIVLLASCGGYLWANWGDVFSWFNPFAQIRSQVSMWWWN